MKFEVTSQALQRYLSRCICCLRLIQSPGW